MSGFNNCMLGVIVGVSIIVYAVCECRGSITVYARCECRGSITMLGVNVRVSITVC